MDEKQRVKNCIHFGETDRIPWQINFTSELGLKLMDHLNIEREEYTVLGKNIFSFNRLDDFLGNHLAYLRNRLVDSLVETEPGIFRDEWNVCWDRRIDRDIGTPVNCLLEDMNLDRLAVAEM